MEVAAVIAPYSGMHAFDNALMHGGMDSTQTMISMHRSASLVIDSAAALVNAC